jgi:hypothetical protein
MKPTNQSEKGKSHDRNNETHDFVWENHCNLFAERSPTERKKTFSAEIKGSNLD